MEKGVLLDMPTTIPIAQPHIGDAEVEAVVRVLRSGQLAQGSEVAAFEEEFAELVDGRHCIAVNSGTSALYLSLLALRIGPGDEVIVPSFTFGATVHAVVLAGATPIFADIDPATFCLDPRSVTAAITARTAAIMPVHLFGHPAAMDQLGLLAKHHALCLIEDAAQAVGARLDSRPVGALGNIGCFSFYPTKNMHSIEGGMITTDDQNLAGRLRLLRNQGMSERYLYEIVGLNAHMTDVAAAVGRVQLRSLPLWVAARRRNAAELDAGLHGVGMPTVAAGVEHAYHQYTIRAPGNRDTLAGRAARHGVTTAVYYPTPVHRTPAYHRHELPLPQTDQAAAEVLSLPVHPALSTADLMRIIEVINT
jgi:dTDP-4-amino-4,6-dideoxygalactose transaminase